MSGNIKVEMQKGVLDYYSIWLERSTAKNTGAIARSVEQQVAQLGNIAAGISENNAAIMQATEIADKTLAEQKKLTAIAELTAAERKEQVAIRNAVFAFKKDVDYVVNNTTGLTRYFELSELLSVCDSKLIQYINKLEELSDKEYADNLITKVNESVNKSFEILTNAENNDLLLINKLSGKLTNQWQKVNELSSGLSTSQENLSKESVELRHLERRLKSLLAMNRKRPSRLGSIIKLSLLVVPATMLPLTITIPFVITPLIVAFLASSRVREWIGDAFNAIIKGPVATRDLEKKIFIAKSELEQKEISSQTAETNLLVLKEAATQLENELTSLFEKYSLA